MTKMSRLEKFFVNRRGKSFKKAMSAIEGSLAISDKSHILEIGAGSGKLSLLINEKYHPATLVITDYDEDQLKLAEKNLRDTYGSIPPNCKLEKADALNLHYPAETFDAVFALMVFHHLGKHEMYKGLDEIGRVLKTGGQLVYSEILHKKKIRDYLSGRGFEISYRKGRLLGLVDSVVVIKKTSEEEG